MDSISIPAEKTCTKCGIAKALEEFYTHPAMRDGHQNACKECVKRKTRAYSKTDAGRATEERRNQTTHRHEYRTAYNKSAEGLAAFARYKQSEHGRATIKESQRRYAQTDYGRAARNAAVVRDRIVYPEKSAARDAVRAAIKVGRLIPWTVCAVPECSCAIVEGHHPDYDRHLDVVWLCRKHHLEAHAIAKGLGKLGNRLS